MALLYVAFIVMMMIVDVATDYGRATQLQTRASSGTALGAEMLLVRNALEAYLQATPSGSGPVALSQLGLPTWFVPNGEIFVQIEAGRGFVYHTPRSDRASVEELVGLHMSGFAGIAVNQRLVSPRLNTHITLPSTIPERSIVLML